MSKKKFLFVMLFIVFITIIFGFFLLGIFKKHEETSYSIKQLKSMDPEESLAAENMLIEIGQPAVEPLRKAYSDEVLKLKYYEMVKNLKRPLKKDKNIVETDEKGKVFVQNIIRFKNVLIKLGDKNAVDEGVIKVILSYVDNSYLQEEEVREIEKLFKSTGGLSVRRLMEFYRTSKNKRQPGVVEIFLLGVVDSDSVDILIDYMNDKSEKIRAMAAELLGYTEDRINREYYVFCPYYTLKDSRKADLYFHLKPRIYEPVSPFEYRFGFDELKTSLRSNEIDKSRAVKDPRDILRELRKKFSNTGAVEPLIKALDDPSLEVRRAAIRSLGLIGDDRAVIPITRFLKERDDRFGLDQEAVIALGYVGDERAVQPLLEYFDLLKTEFDLMEMCYTIRSLGMIGSNDAVEPLIEIVEERYSENIIEIIKREGDYRKGNLSYELKSRSMIALGFIGDKKAVLPLIKILLSRQYNRYLSHDLSSIAAFSLGLIGDQRALEPLKKALEHKDSDKNIIKWAIAEIEKKSPEGNKEGRKQR